MATRSNRVRQVKYKGLTLETWTSKPRRWEGRVLEGGFNDAVGYNRRKVLLVLKDSVNKRGA